MLYNRFQLFPYDHLFIKKWESVQNFLVRLYASIHENAYKEWEILETMNENVRYDLSVRKLKAASKEPQIEIFNEESSHCIHLVGSRQNAYDDADDDGRE